MVTATQRPERQRGPHSLDTHIGQVEPKQGMGSSAACPKQGSMRLVSWDGESATVRTNCKTWRCTSCCVRMMNLFKMRIESGCLTLGRCALITLTYQADSPRLADVRCVEKDWKALWRRLKGRRESRLKWMRVMEVTRRMIPHYHLVAGPVEGRVRCYRDRLLVGPYLKHFSSCDCLSHRLAREWQEVTGDSYIVHAMEVTGARGAAAYLGKYLLKTFGAEGRLAALGMKRRWSSSRGWPGSGRLRMKVTDEKLWRRKLSYWTPGFLADDQIEDGLERSGNEVVMALTKRNVERTQVKKIMEVSRA